MSRKTYDVATIVENANRILANDTHGPEFRKGVMLMVEEVLHDSGNYRGYSYLIHNEVPPGELPGIQMGDSAKAAFENTDSTRVAYA